MIVTDYPQRSAEWFAARLGRLCASDAKDMLATVKTGEAAARRDLRMRLVLERITGQSQGDDYINADMQRGIDLEPQARTAYEFRTGRLVSEVGFIQHDTLMAGCSPDGFVRDEMPGIADQPSGLVEFKCPRSAKHLTYLRSGTVPPEHRAQLVHQLWITGAAWVDFVSFDPQMPEKLQLFIVRLVRDAAEIAAYAATATAFLADVDAEEAAVRALAA